jgi:hypothetical protein
MARERGGASGDQTCRVAGHKLLQQGCDCEAEQHAERDVPLEVWRRRDGAGRCRLHEFHVARLEFGGGAEILEPVRSASASGRARCLAGIASSVLLTASIASSVRERRISRANSM